MVDYPRFYNYYYIIRLKMPGLSIKAIMTAISIWWLTWDLFTVKNKYHISQPLFKSGRDHNQKMQA